jgi:tetratricopeptide (TPR) repeat protein
MAAAMFWFWMPRSYWREGLKWLKDTLARIPDQLPQTPAQAKALLMIGYMAMELPTADILDDNWFKESLKYWQEVGNKWWTAYALDCLGWHFLFAHDANSARARFEQAVALARKAEDDWILGYSLRGLGAAIERFDYSDARPILEESVSVTRAAGDQWAQADGLSQLSTVALGQRDYARVATLSEEALSIYQKIGDRENTANSLYALAYAMLGQGDSRRAARLCKECLILAQSVGYRWAIAGALIGSGGAAGREGRPRRSVILLAAAMSLYNSMGYAMATWPWVLAEYERFMASARAQLNDAEFIKATAEGQAMTLEQAVQYALEDAGDGRPNH